MRHSVLAGSALLFSVLASCSDGSTLPTQETPPISLAAAANSNACSTPKGHPGGKILDTLQAQFPWAVAVRDDGLSYFTELFNNRVGVTDTRNRTITRYIQVGSLPTGIAFSPDGATAYTANQGDNTVTIVDVATGQQTGSVSIAASPFSVQVSPDGDQIFVGNNDNTLSVVDAATRQVVKTVIVGFATNAFAVDGSGRMLYASSFVSGTVSEIDIFTGNVLRTFNIGGTTQGVALNRKGTRLFVANQGGYLTEVNLLTGQIGAQIPLAGVGFGVGVTPDDNEAWITLPLDGKVQVFNLNNRRISGTMTVGGEPRRVAFSQAGKIGAITNTAGYITFVR